MFGADTEDAVRQHLCIIHTDVLPAAVARVKTSNESVSTFLIILYEE